MIIPAQMRNSMSEDAGEMLFWAEFLARKEIKVVKAWTIRYPGGRVYFWKKIYSPENVRKIFYNPESEWKNFYSPENVWKFFYSPESEWKKFYSPKTEWKKFYSPENISKITHTGSN